MGAQRVDFGRTLEVARVDRPHEDEDEVAEGVPEHSRHLEDRVEAQAVVAVDEHDRRPRLRVGLARRGLRGGRARGGLGVGGLDNHVQPPQFRADGEIVALDRERRDDQQPGQEEGCPAALEELHRRQARPG